MKKILSAFIMGVISFIAFSLCTEAATIITGTVNSSNGLNIRKSATTGAKIIATVKNGYNLSLVSTTKYSGTGCSSKWYKVSYGSSTGYACSGYIKNVKSVNTNNLYLNSNWSARINATGGVAFRKGASTSYGNNGNLHFGANLSVLGTASKGNGCNTNWYKVKYNNITGYICGTYVTYKSATTSSAATYNNTWKSLGFPASYWPFLTKLKTAHPKWNFKAINTGESFIDAVQGETGKNSIQLVNSNYDKALITSMTTVEVGGWKNVNAKTIAFYLDPRNFLNEKNVVMFEDLKYNSSTHTANVVTDMFDTGSNKKHANSFVTSGKAYNISPAHLASRSIQEVGRSGNSMTAGTFSGYSGYYNFFNIGSYASCTIGGKTYKTQTCGMYYAKNNKWDSVLDAINGGAVFLKDRYYNNNGQKTLYNQKFNVNNGKYTNQYMTNIQAPVSEGRITYDSYVNKAVYNNALTFLIPVFSSMPSYTSLPSNVANSTTVVTPPKTTVTKKAPAKKLNLTRTLKRGSKGTAVKNLQKALKIKADGKFGSKTKSAVKKYQKKKKLKADGVVGKKTAKKLGWLWKGK